MVVVGTSHSKEAWLVPPLGFLHPLIQDALVGRKKKMVQNTIMTTLTSSNHRAVEGNVFSALSMSF